MTAQNPPSPPSSNPPPANQPPPARSPPHDTPSPQDRAPRNGSNHPYEQRDPAGRPGAAPNAPQPFEALDRSSAGYLTRADAARDRWLSGRFGHCDADRDGRLPRAEYDTCSRTPDR